MIAWAVETVVATTVLMLGVLALRRPVQRAFGARVAYLLWLLPALRMVLPPLPADWREASAAPIAAMRETIGIYVEPVATAAGAAPEAAIDPVLLIGAAWIAGAALFFAWHSMAHAIYVRRLLALPSFRRPLTGGAQLVETDAAAGPVAFGVLQRFVAVPRDFAQMYDEEERALAIAHELSHHARGDLIANWFALAVLALHWPNPVAWFAYRAFRADQELANDARVLAGRSAADRHAYARAIVKAAGGAAVSAVCHLHTIADLKGRLRMLTQLPKSRRTTNAGTAGVAILVSVALGLTASGTAAAERVRAAAAAIPEIAPISVWQAPPAPPAVVAPSAKPAPAAPPATLPLERKQRRNVTVIQDGKTVYSSVLPVAPPTPPQMPALAVLAEVPNVIERDCSDKRDTSSLVLSDERGGSRRIILCRQRIERITATASAHAAAQAGAHAAQASAHASARAAQASARAAQARARAEHAGAYAHYSRRHALAGLRAGRAAIVRERNLTEEQRARALEGVDQAIREMEAPDDVTS